ncbi:MAG TPA: hypothetical protein HA257_04580 [Candidatus Methanoperedenaceae archaeon]|nr:hypothetical protein [Candidatus Methanoperedenaceae archaeon]
MKELYILPYVSFFDAHDVALRDWLRINDDAGVRKYMGAPGSAQRLFPENARRALAWADSAFDELRRLMVTIASDAVFLDISTDHDRLEEAYNLKALSSQELWCEYTGFLFRSPDGEVKREFYRKYMAPLVEGMSGLIEGRRAYFYDVDEAARSRFIPVCDAAFDANADFMLALARLASRMGGFREAPRHIWHTTPMLRQKAVLYEESAAFHAGLMSTLARLLKARTRGYIVRNIHEQAYDFLSRYERFLDMKSEVDSQRMNNIVDRVLSQDEVRAVMLCEPMHFMSMRQGLERAAEIFPEMRLGKTDITILLKRMSRFTQMFRNMQANYVFALDVLGVEMRERYSMVGEIVPGV